MTHAFLSVRHLERRFSTGNTETLDIKPGVNILVGKPNTGKTKWLQTLDYLFAGENPFEGAHEEGLAEKYDAAAAGLVIGEEHIRIERKWREPGAKTKVLVNGEGMAERDFQHLLLEKLGIPKLNFPKGNPFSGQTWPELSFRTLFRHIYRQQRFWSDIADKQHEGEQHASLLQFLGLAERLFTEDNGHLVKLKMDIERLKARRDQYAQTLDELARDVLSDSGTRVGANVTTVHDAGNRITGEIASLRKRRMDLIASGRDQIVPPEQRGHVSQLSEERASLTVSLEDMKCKAKATAERVDQVQRYRHELADEIERLTRAEDAGTILADLRITHCPACDQPVANTSTNPKDCFLCHQVLPDEPLVEDLGTHRLRFERDRLTGEFTEAEELLMLLQRDSQQIGGEIVATEERLRMLENELAPARQAVSAFVQEEVSAIDMALGELNERQRQVGRISGALELGQELTDRIAEIELEIEPLQVRVEEAIRGTDFEAGAAKIEEGMNAYLTAINLLRDGVWRHSPVAITVTRSTFTIRVGQRRWNAALGGTDTLYFLMAYHYGLLTLSDKPECHYPGLSIIDVPGEFSGEEVEDKENFIVQPFIDLLQREEYNGAQTIITGVSFAGLEEAHRLHLTNVHVA